MWLSRVFADGRVRRCGTGRTDHRFLLNRLSDFQEPASFTKLLNQGLDAVLLIRSGLLCSSQEQFNGPRISAGCFVNELHGNYLTLGHLLTSRTTREGDLCA